MTDTPQHLRIDHGLTHEATTHANPEYTPTHGWEQYTRQRQTGPRPLTNMGRAQHDAFNAGVAWVIATQHAVDELTVSELVWELRKRDASVFWPLFVADPKFWGVCDRCRTRQLFDARGLCDGCGEQID